MKQYGMVLVTSASQTEAEAIAQTLVQQKLAACVNLMPIQSIYRWQGEVCQAAEWQLMIKTEVGQFEAICVQIQAIHSYDVPEIILLPIVAGSAAYLDWIGAQVQPSD